MSANQVTLTRLLLLPVPMAMMYRQTTGWMLAALVLFVVLGLTDAVDGMLARRYGSTPLGALLDPIVDKIFLVAAFGPLADLRMLPPVIVTAVFVREFAVTVLRSIALEEKIEFRTSRVAKLKTTVQMAGAGFIFLYWLFPGGPALTAIQVAAVVGAAVAPIARWARRRTPGWRAWSGFLLITFAGSVRWFVGASETILILSGIIVAFTVYSGLEYFWGLRRRLAARFGRMPIDAVRLAALAIVVPVGFLPALQRTGAPIWAILAVVALELAAGGIDNALAQVGVARGPGPDLWRAAAQGAAAVGMIATLSVGGPVLAAHGFGALAVLVTAGDVCARFWRHRDHFLSLSRL